MGLFSFMKRRRLFIIFLGCLAAAILVFTLWPSEREPEYKGITLTKYLDRAAGSPNEELTEAIKHIGTNALPYLLRAVDYHPPRWKFALGWKILKLPWTKLNGRLALWLLDEKDLRRAESAVIAFGILGRDARPALDDLKRMASKNPTSFASQAMLNINSAFRGNFEDFDTGRIRS